MGYLICTQNINCVWHPHVTSCIQRRQGSDDKESRKQSSRDLGCEQQEEEGNNYNAGLYLLLIGELSQSKENTGSSLMAVHACISKYEVCIAFSQLWDR